MWNFWINLLSLDVINSLLEVPHYVGLNLLCLKMTLWTKLNIQIWAASLHKDVLRSSSTFFSTRVHPHSHLWIIITHSIPTAFHILSWDTAIELHRWGTTAHKAERQEERYQVTLISPFLFFAIIADRKLDNLDSHLSWQFNIAYTTLIS